MEQTVPSHLYEIIIVSDGPLWEGLASVRTMIAKTNGRLLELPERKGVAIAKNAGAAEAAGHLLIFLDDDILARNNLVETYARVFESENSNSLAFGPVNVEYSSGPKHFFEESKKRQQLFFRKIEEGENTSPFFFSGANFSMPAATFRANGGFDETFRGYGWEEADFGVRLHRAGVRFHYVKEAAVTELYERNTSLGSETFPMELGRNEILFLRRYPEYRRCSAASAPFTGSVLRRTAARWALQGNGIIHSLTSLCPAAALKNKLLFLQNYWAGVTSAGASGEELARLFGQRVAVVAYHDVVDSVPETPYDISLHELRRQFDALERLNFTPIKLADFIDWLRNGILLPAKPVVITFDDAYTSFMRYVVPELQKRGWPATVFACSDYVGKTNVWDEGKAPRKEIMSTQDIESLPASIDVCSHSRSHKDLCNVDAATLFNELNSDIRNRAIAYPFGSHNKKVRVAAMQSGYECGFTMDSGMNTHTTDPFALKRVEITSGDSDLSFRIKMRTGRWFPQEMRRWMRKRFRE